MINWFILRPALYFINKLSDVEKKTGPRYIWMQGIWNKHVSVTDRQLG